MAKTEIVHKDILGTEISIGDFVISSSYNARLGMFKVDKLTAKMVKITSIKRKNTVNRYPTDMVVITKEQGVLALLSNCD